MSVRTPTLAGLLNRVMNRTMEEIRVALPAKIVAYDATKQTADVQPLIKEFYEDEAGDRQSESIPVITSVPIIFPGGGGFHAVFPLAVGDTILLVFSDRSLDAWQSEGNESDPADERRHHITDAVAIPGLHANRASIPGVSATDATFGSDSGPRVVAKASEIHLGATATVPAVDALVKGTTYRAAEDTMLTLLSTALAAVATAIASPAAVTASGPAAATACTAAVAAITSFKASAATYLSTIVKTK